MSVIINQLLEFAVRLIVEKLVCIHIIHSVNNVLDNSQHGFTPSKSTYLSFFVSTIYT